MTTYATVWAGAAGSAPTASPRDAGDNNFSSRAQSVALAKQRGSWRNKCGRMGCCERGHGPFPFDHAAAPAHVRLIKHLSDGRRLVPFHRFRALARRLNLLVAQPVELDARVCNELDARCKVGHEREELAELLARDTEELAGTRRAHLVRVRVRVRVTVRVRVRAVRTEAEASCRCSMPRSPKKG